MYNLSTEDELKQVYLETGLLEAGIKKWLNSPLRNTDGKQEQQS